MQILGDRLSNELTRESALKAITMLASKQQKIKLQNLSNLTPRLVALLHQAQRQIHLSTLETLLALLSRYGEQFVPQAAQLQAELVKFINENDIQRSSLAIQCSTNIIGLNKQIKENSDALQQCIQLSGSQLINGSIVIANLQAFFAEACKAGIVNQQVVDRLIDQSSLSTRSSAKIAALIICSNFGILGDYIGKLFQIV